MEKNWNKAVTWIYRISKPVFLMLALIFIILGQTDTAEAAGIKVGYDGKEIEYTDTQVTYTFNGKKIDSSYPGIILNGVSLAPCSEVFIKSGMNITYKYSKAKGLLYLYYEDHLIKLKIGSTTADVDGKKVQMKLAPRLIRVGGRKTEKLYIPARFVAEQFGFVYEWNSKTGIAAITSPPLKLRYDGKNVDYFGKKIKVVSENVDCTTKDYPALLIGDTVLAPAKLTFAGKAVNGTYKYDSKTGAVTISKYGNTVQMKLNSTKALVNGKEQKMPAAPKKIQFQKSGVTVIYIPVQFVAKAIGYEYLYIGGESLVSIKAPYSIYYENEWHFPEVKGSVTFEGKEVELAPLYSYIENDTAMLRAKKVFAGALGCSYQYDSAAKTLTLSRENNGTVNTVVFTIGSTTAYVNGEKKTMTAPARSVKCSINNTNYIMVPGRFTATALGFGYEWLDAGNTSVITAGKKDTPKPDQGTGEVVPSVPKTETLFQWNPGNVYAASLEEMKQLSLNDVQITGRTQENVSAEYTSLIDVEQAVTPEQKLYDTYYLHSSDGFFQITGGVKDKVLELVLSETISTDTNYQFAGGLASEAVVDFDEKTLSTKVSFMLGSEASEHYSVTLSEDYRTITVRIYRICLEGVTGQRKNGSDILTFRGTDKLQMEILADNSNDSAILLQMTGALDTLSDVNWTGTEEGGIISVIRIPVSANQTQFLVQKKAGCGYYLMESGEEVNLVVTDTSSISYSMKIPYMPGTNLDAIRDKDDYQNNRFTITLPGDQTAYLQAVPIININNVITGIKTTLNAEGNTVITVTTSKLQAYKLNYTSSEILVEVGNPKDLFDKIVVLDAGHGGKDPGTQRNGYSEKDLNLEMIYTKMQAYFDNSDIKAYWTREDDTFIELKDRAAFASKVGADIFVSLHMNSFTTVSPNGLSVFYAKENKTATSGGLNSYGLADILQRNLVKGLGCNDRKVKSNSYVVCKSNTVPAVIIELGFMSNPGELKKLTSASYQNKAAKYIYESIVQVFQEYPTGR